MPVPGASFLGTPWLGGCLGQQGILAAADDQLLLKLISGFSSLSLEKPDIVKTGHDN